MYRNYLPMQCSVQNDFDNSRNDVWFVAENNPITTILQGRIWVVPPIDIAAE